MLHTEKTDQVFHLLKTYANTSDQWMKVDEAYDRLLVENDNEDRVIIALLGYVLDGLRFGNWLWNMPPNAGNVILDSPPQQTVTCPAHGHTHTYPESNKTGLGDMSKKQW
jgi:hypothetical protein